MNDSANDNNSKIKGNVKTSATTKTAICYFFYLKISNKDNKFVFFVTDSKLVLYSVLFTFTSISLEIAWGNPVPFECQEPDNLMSTFQHDAHESILMLSPNSHRQTGDIEFFRHTRRTYLLGNRTCQRSGITSEQQYLCSWHFVLNRDINRRPEDIYEAKCNCKDQPCAYGFPHSRCHPVKYYVRVLRKYACDLSTRTYKYREAIEPVVVGCTCALG